MSGKPKSFRTSSDFRSWLEKNHGRRGELIVRLFKVHARARGIGYREALDEALCFGWIDGVRRSLDADSFTQRFTPRRKKSAWSAVNIRRVQELIAEGRLAPAGLEAFNARDASATAPYSFEHTPKAFEPALEKRFRSNRTAWEWWQKAAPYYRRVCTFYVMSARKAETRERRLDNLVRHCEQGRKIPPLASGKA